jgi:SET domain-containing protein
MKLFPSSKIFLDKSDIENAGRGVFANKKISKDEVIEVCPIILINEKEVQDLRKTELHNYYFMWGDDKANHKGAICLGFGSLYNHSYTPNATYRKNKSDGTIEFIAIKDITSNEEISVNYNYGNPEDKSKLWIEEIPPAE